MKKIVTILVAIILIIIGIFAFRSCNSEQPTTNQNPEDTSTTTEENPDAIARNDETKSAFIEASVEFSCLLLDQPELENQPEQAKEELNKIYAKYGLPVVDDNQMIQLLNDYSNDQAIFNQIKERTSSC